MLLMLLLAGGLSSCVPAVQLKTPSNAAPASFNGSADTENSAKVNWREYFQDPHLTTLIDDALANNQELNIFLQELEIAKNEASARSGAYLPSVELGGGVGLDKPGRFTRNGSVEENLDISEGRKFPEPLTNFSFGARAIWEVDIWKRLRNAQKSALTRFLATQEGKNFLVTNLISEIANSYYELCALDGQLAIAQQNIKIQESALETAQLEKAGARVTELAVKRFEAQKLKTESLQFDIHQKIIETENRVNFLLGRYPQPVERSSQAFIDKAPPSLRTGIPSELLQNRADIRQAELDIAASELDVKVAQAAFYPSLTLTADIGYEAYRVGKILQTPESLLYSLSAGITGPLINRRAITADLMNANAKQIQAVFNYERTLIKAFVESANQIANLQNLDASIKLRRRQVDALTSSVDIANTLFTAARADYSEVLLTQRDAIESRFELIDSKLKQLQASVNLYRALGGGWTREENSPIQIDSANPAGAY